MPLRPNELDDLGVSGIARRGTVALNESVALDLDRRCLWFGRIERPLTKAKFDLLEYLVQHSGRAVSADELVRAGVFVPSQRMRYRAIALELRNKLGEARSIIRTVPGYGYRCEPQAGQRHWDDARGWPLDPPRVLPSFELSVLVNGGDESLSGRTMQGHRTVLEGHDVRQTVAREIPSASVLR